MFARISKFESVINKHIPVQSQNDMSMFKVNNVDTRTTSLKDTDVFRIIGSPTMFRKKKTGKKLGVCKRTS